MNPVYCKYSNDRAARFQIKTTIQMDENGKKSVCKYALTDAAKVHVEKLYEHYLQMEAGAASSILAPNKCRKIEGGVELEYVEGETFEQHLDRLYFEGKYMELVEEIRHFRDVLYSLPDNHSFYYTDEFDQVFGKHTAFSDERSLKVSNIDLVFGNIILGDPWTVIDYEWTMDFPVPVTYIFYRALHYYLCGSEKRKALQEMHLFRLLDISEEAIKMYTEMECCFQHYVEDGRCTMPVLKSYMLERSIDVRDVVSDRRTDMLQIYMDTGAGFQEEHSIRKFYYYKDQTVECKFESEDGLCALRIDPAAAAVLIRDFELWGDGVRLQPAGTNGLILSEGIYAFGTGDPQFLFTELGEVKQLKLSFSVAELKDAWETAVVDLTGRCQRQEEELKQQREELKRQKEKAEQLLAAKTAAESYIESIRSRLFWRVGAKLKRFFSRKQSA